METQDSAQGQVSTPLANRGRLRLTRLARALSQEQLAQASGVSRQAIAGVESGRWAPSLKVALAISRALGSSVEELFGAEAPLPQVDALVVSEEDRGRWTVGWLWPQSWAGSIAYPLRNDSASDFGFRPASAVVAPGGDGAEGAAPAATRDEPACPGASPRTRSRPCARPSSSPGVIRPCHCFRCRWGGSIVHSTFCGGPAAVGRQSNYCLPVKSMWRGYIARDLARVQRPVEERGTPLPFAERSIR